LSPPAPPESTQSARGPLPPLAPPNLLPAGYTRSRGITISPAVVAWIPAVSLALILLLTLTSWVGVYSGEEHPVYTQGAWRAISGYPKQSIQLEEFLLKDLPPPSIYDRTRSDWVIMVPYLLALILALVLAWAERINSRGVQARIPSLWPYRHAIIAGFAGAALILLTVEATRGFGLERALDSAVADKFEAERKNADTPGEQKKVDFHQRQELAKYDLERTGWFDLVLCLHVLAMLALLARVGLERHGNRPPPRIVVQY
jgi:hypothetical protein